MEKVGNDSDIVESWKLPGVRDDDVLDGISPRVSDDAAHHASITTSSKTEPEGVLDTDDVETREAKKKVWDGGRWLSCIQRYVFHSRAAVVGLLMDLLELISARARSILDKLGMKRRGQVRGRTYI